MNEARLKASQEGACLDLQPRSVDALILAGGVNEIPLFDGYQPGYKALIPFAERPSIQYTLDALRGSRYVRDICVVGPEEELRAAVGEAPVSFTPGGDSLLGSVVNGLEFFRDRDLVLITTADLPLVTPAAMETFLEACARTPTEFPENLYVSAIPREAFTGPFATTKKAMSAFRDGTLCHGNVMLVQPHCLNNVVAVQRVNAMYAARKSALKSALALGLGVGLAYVLGIHFLHLLTARQMARRVSRRFNLGIVPVLVPQPELAIDVDEPGDYELVRKVLEVRTAGAEL